MSRERRSYPRFTVGFPVKVSLPDAEDLHGFPAEASNLSRTSIQINCDAELLAALLKQAQLPYSCDLDFDLPWHDHHFKITAQVVTHRRVSQFQYVLVLLLKHDDETQEELLEKLLNREQASSSHQTEV